MQELKSTREDLCENEQQSNSSLPFPSLLEVVSRADIYSFIPCRGQVQEE